MMKTYLVMILVVLSASLRAQCELDMMLLLDQSGSMAATQGRVADAANAFINKLSLGENRVKMGIVTFGDDGVLRSPLTSNKKQLLDEIEKYRTTDCSPYTTNLAPALAIGASELYGGRKITKLILIISDGLPQGTDKIREIVSVIKKTDNYIICSIFIWPLGSADGSGIFFLEEISSENCSVGTDAEHFAEELHKSLSKLECR